MSASDGSAGVLTIGKLGASGAQLQYYEQQVAAGLEDYYAGRGEAPGRWRGAGADALGLPAGEQVERDAFMALMEGRSPVDGEVLRRMGACSTVAALDLTFSAPKSVSVLFATAEDRLSAALVDAHERAVDEALGYLEREACFTRRGHGGAERVRADGLIAASYRHRMSRAGSAVMIARDNHTREQLNHAARDRLKRDGALPATGTWVIRHEYAPGDRVIARRNSRYHDVDNGTVATVIEIDARTHRMRLETDLGEVRELDLAYVAKHVQHAYALTGHGAQGATVTWAGVIGRPEEFTREWAYTALSRAREHTTLHLIAGASEHQRDRDSYAPAEVARDTATTIRALHQAMRRSETEPLALDHLQPADQHLAQSERVLAVRGLGLPGGRAQQRGHPGPLTPPSRASGPSNKQRGPSIAR